MKKEKNKQTKNVERNENRLSKLKVCLHEHALLS